MVNALEVISILILLAKFGDQDQSNDPDQASELIEHKINLLLILFDMRDSGKVNVVEIMIMARTTMQGFAKMYPKISFFQNQEILEEFRPAIMDLFKSKIEEELQLEYEKIAKLSAN